MCSSTAKRACRGHAARSISFRERKILNDQITGFCQNVRM
jgi:hypothetical protein